MSILKREYVHDAMDWVIDSYNLEQVWNFVKAFHTPNLGYHNLEHLKVVTGAAAWLSLREGVDPKLPVIAAMFHDMGHTGKQPDTQNVDLAISWFRRACEAKYSYRPLLSLSYAEESRIVDAIRSTTYEGGEFPFGPRSPEGKILRDADLWNPHLLSLNAKTMIAGLGRELGAWTHSNRSKGLISNYEFFTKVVWFTKTAQDMAPAAMQHLKELVEEVAPYHFTPRPQRPVFTKRYIRHDYDDDGDDGEPPFTPTPKVGKIESADESEGGHHD